MVGYTDPVIVVRYLMDYCSVTRAIGVTWSTNAKDPICGLWSRQKSGGYGDVVIFVSINGGYGGHGWWTRVRVRVWWWRRCGGDHKCVGREFPCSRSHGAMFPSFGRGRLGISHLACTGLCRISISLMVINMPRAIVGDTSRTKSYIPKVSEILGFSPVLAKLYKPIENRCIHEGRVVDQLYYKSNGIERMFTNVRFNCLFEIRGHRDHLPASLAHLLYCIVFEEQYNLAYFYIKRIESARATPTANLPYGMFLTRLYRHVMERYPHLDNGIYDVVDRVMRPLSLKQTRKPQSGHGKARHSISSTSAHHNYGSSSYHGDDDEDDDASHASTPSFVHSITKDTAFPLLLNKMMVFSSSDKLSCSINLNKSMKKLEVDSNHSGRHCEESSKRKLNEDVE
uniref:Ribosomal protein L7Ae/L30e/S12e/Gadd45 n=1 Tax=Tanacetum cinerariifolium TaxID=118510 RepID=A0A6L2N0L5_TANCI|nr:ribosomal protein L7Ae/L30e/S12e/Gadd45 [Tanacetum cinerariifolium]